MTDSAGSPPAKSKRRPGRRWKIVLTALVLAGLAATWQQGLLEDGLNELRRYRAAAAQPPPDVGSTAIGAFDFHDITRSMPLPDSDGHARALDVESEGPLFEAFDPMTTPMLSDVDLERLRIAVATIDTNAVCPEAEVPTSLDGHAEVLRIANGCLHVEYEPLNGRTLEQARQALERDITVHAVGLPPRELLHAQSSHSYDEDPRARDQWHLPVLDAQALWRGWPSGSQVTVAVIDDGVYGNHRDLDDNTLTVGGDCHRNPNGNHGTHVAGIIAAEQGNGQDVAGVAPNALILPIKVHFTDDYDDNHPVDPVCFQKIPTLTRAIVKAIIGEVDIINMSFRWRREIVHGLDTVETAIRVAMMRDIIVVAAAGNCGDDQLISGKRGWEWQRCLSHNQRQPPAMYPGVVAVASVDENLMRADSSTSNEDVKVAAPGVEILSTYAPNRCNWFVGVAGAIKDWFNGDKGGCIERLDGSSMAAPVVSGVLAHLLARFPDLPPSTLVQVLYDTAYDPTNPGTSGRSNDLGFGIVDPTSAIRRLNDLTQDETIDQLPAISVLAPDYSAIEQSTGETPVMLIADVSGSMGDTVDGQSKLEIAKESIVEFLITLSPTRHVALRSYPAAGGKCNEGELRFTFAPKTAEMESIVLGLRADGDTPTAEALAAAVEDTRVADFSQAEIALFSDGLANCGDPCRVADEIAASGIEIRVHIGAFVDSDEGREQLKCISDLTGGSYMEGSDVESAFAAELGEFLERSSKPRLEVTVEAPESVVPLTGPSGEQRVATSIRNDSNVAAKDVVLLLETRDGVGRRRDSLAVGNVAPGGESTVTWRLRPGFEDVGTVLDVVLTATAANTDEVVSSAGSVAVEDPNVADEAGPILGVGQIVVMGDQLLSGVGTSTRGPYGGCRRSRNIGLLEVFGQPAERSLACANALMAHLAAPDWAKDVDSQINQLVDLREGEGAISAVVLSIGATDFGLSELTRECVMSNVPCDSEIAGVPTEEWLGESVAGGGPRHAAASAHLVRALGTVDEALNQTRDRSRGTRQVPILLLAQPRAFPFVHGACFERWQGEDLPLMTQPELNLYHHFVSVVNGTLEAAAVASQDLGLPVFYVDTTESAYLPDHTACSAEPYVQSLEPLVEAGSRVIKTLSEGGVAAVAGGEFNEDTLVELGEEFLVPNEYGEQALANAVLRWSQSDEAQEADDFVSDEFQRRSAGIAPRVSEPTVGETRTFSQPGRAAIEPGRGWTASTSGFLPGALVTASLVPGERVVASAVADENGTAELYVAVPKDIAAGDVTLVARGVSRSGEAISVEQPARILPPLRPIHSVALPALAVLLLLSSVGLWRASRRTVTVAAPLRDES